MLKLRSHEAECARQDLESIRQDIQRQERILDEARDAFQAVADVRKTGSIGQRFLARIEAFRQAADDRVQKERRKLESLKKREEEARLVLMKRKSAEETIRHLEEKERATFWKDFRSAESEQLDEQAITGYQRQRRAASQ